MISVKQIITITLRSTLNLLAAFVFILLLNWLLTTMGAWLSDFPGVIKLDGIQVKAMSKIWNLKQVLGIYLFPYLGFVFIYLVFATKRQVPVKLPSPLHLFFSWVYTLLIVVVFLVPICEMFNRNGIYYALSWLHFNRFEKILFAVVLLMLYIIRVFRISPVFSSSLIIPPYTFIKGRPVHGQISLLWYIPYLLLFLSVMVISTHFSFSQNCLLTGLFFTLLLNTPLIIKYKVIIK
jgi:hypothetical protein